MNRRLRFALFGNTFQAKKSTSVQKLLVLLEERKAEILIDQQLYDFLTKDMQITVNPSELISGNDFQADVVVSRGGDGTFLEAARRVGDKEIPILGINMGRLGFLADFSPEDIAPAINQIYAGEARTELRSVLQIEYSQGKPKGYPFALNEVAVLKRDNSSMISIRVDINGEYLTTYQADGLIVSTPTGSTAYSLSNGGPVVVPGTGVFIMTAVAPHSLNIRPVVIPDSAEVTLDVESRNHSFLVAIDGRSEKCGEGTRITLRRAPYNIQVVKRSGTRYFSTLREKLMWGADVR